MLNTFYGIKLGQTQTYTADGVRIPVTEVYVEPLTVVQVKTGDKDGYTALKVAFGSRKEKNISKSVLGELAKIKNKNTEDSKTEDGETVASKTEEKEEKTGKAEQKSAMEQSNNGAMLSRYFREIRIKNNEDIKDRVIGSKINVADIFKEGDILNVSGVTISKGFAGVVKRHGFKGGPRTHGQCDRERAPGSIGQTTTPGRVYKGKRMAGRMGGLQATCENLQVVKIDNDKNVVQIKGLVPGKKSGVVILYK